MTLPLLVSYPLARSARTRARRIFAAGHHRQIEDPEVVRIQKARAWTAAVISCLILLVYGKPGDMAQAREEYWARLMATPWLLLLTAPVVGWLLFRWASPDARRVMRPRLRASGRLALWYFGALSLVPVLAALAAWSTAHLMPAVFGKSSVDVTTILLMPVVTFVPWIPMIWVLLFVVFASGPAVRSAFNTAEAHPALPALLTGALVWEFMVISVATADLPPGPPLIQIGSLLGGPVSVTAVVWWEIHRMRIRHGVTLRG
ncbi:hypothetical protein OIB37_25480 [Streptomyces sp. NBC_00820]|uniref:hypothetical protein n=1 Tax=Streptomyces sp. NBC_00820 TaxID=2975842 RepID=UPI002ED62205|nr:hypothetical protein [Streptomyces sp. NBC_00820]WTI16215.1 hypothetical protein OIB37_25480 [Streptomyces sp. NBC_00820]